MTNTITPLLTILGVDMSCPSDAALAYKVQDRVTPAQLATLEKASKFGWKLGRRVWFHATTNTCAIVLATADNVAIVYPDGKLDRAPHGKKRVTLDQKYWLESAI